jgi:predicted permease
LEESMHSILQDVRFALRSFARSPGFTAVVVLTLSLGIGANVALVSVVRSVLVRPLPYGQPDDIVALWSQWEGFPKTWVSLDEYRYYRDEFESFESAGLYYSDSGNLTDRDDPERVGVAAITPELLATLGVEAALGRSFDAADARTRSSELSILSHRLWERRYGSAADIVGGRIELDGVARIVIGILPPEFLLHTDFGAETLTDVFVPFHVPEGVQTIPLRGGNHSFFVAARLKKGTALEAARAEALAFNRRMESEGAYPEEMRFRTLVNPIAEDVVGGVRPALLVLLGAVGFVLLIACSNVANIVLSRGQERRREIALRTALGAGFRRVFRQMLTESVLLATLGGLGGVLVASLGLAALLAIEPGSIPRLHDARLDATVLLFALLATLLTALLFGVLPAATVTRFDLRNALGASSRGAGAGSGSQRLRSALVALQMALAVVLVAGAGLMIRTFSELVRIDPGFRAEGVLTMRLSTPERDYPTELDIIGFYDRVLNEARRLPGVSDAAVVRILPLATEIGDWGTRIEGYEPAPGERMSADWQIVSSGYFESMGIPLLEGRTFTNGDRTDTEPVGIVNEAFAERFWPNESAVGKRFLTRGADDPPWIRVVGVVGNVRHNGITAEIKEKWYRPHTQWHLSSGFASRAMTLALRASGDLESFVGPVRRIVRDIDPKLPLAEVRTLEEVLAQSVAPSRFTMALLVAFSAMALVLAGVGVYGLASYVVSQRTPEFGVRLALGASPSGVLGLVVKQGLGMAIAGAVVGGVAAFALTSFMSAVLYGVSSRDPVTFALMPLVLMVVALIGSLLPAWRASRVDPVVALRAE